MPRAYSTSWVDYPDWPDRMLNRIVVLENDCWLLDFRGRKGYSTSVRQVLHPPPESGLRASMAYKVIYEFFYGPVAEGVELYGACGDLFCVKPGHRIPLDIRERARITVWRTLGYDNERECARGHPREEFGYRTPQGQLRCRFCETTNRRAHRKKNPEATRLADRRRSRARAGWPTVE